jgi:hypothetical protein
MKEGRLHDELADDRESYYHDCSGFRAMVKHPTMSAAQIESAQERCFVEDVRRLGPSIFRSVQTWLLGYEHLKGSENPRLRLKAESFAVEIRRAYPIFMAGKLLARGADIRRRIADLESRIHTLLGVPTMAERISSLAAFGLALWTGLTLKLGMFQHPRLIRHAFRMPEESLPARVWRKLRGEDDGDHQVQVELRPESTVWVTVAGKLSVSGAERLAADLGKALKKRKERLVLDLESLAETHHEAIEKLAEQLRGYRNRVRVVIPNAEEFAALAVLFAIYR